MDEGFEGPSAIGLLTASPARSATGHLLSQLHTYSSTPKQLQRSVLASPIYGIATPRHAPCHCAGL